MCSVTWSTGGLGPSGRRIVPYRTDSKRSFSEAKNLQKWSFFVILHSFSENHQVFTIYFCSVVVKIHTLKTLRIHKTTQENASSTANRISQDLIRFRLFSLELSSKSYLKTRILFYDRCSLIS